MTGLAAWRRDATLVASFGDAALVPPTEHELAALAAESLFPDTRVHASRWVFARWKPGVALAAAYDVELADGRRELVVAKRYATDKAEALAARERDTERAKHEAVLPGERLHLWAFPADRELPGAARVFELHRTAKVLRELGTLGDWVLRWQSSNVELVRYKPERRAVLRIDWVVRQGSKQGPKSRLAVGARCLPVEDAACTLAARAAAERAGIGAFAPRFLGGEARTGTLFETWLDVRAQERTDFSRSRDAGELLARLARLDPDALRELPLTRPPRLEGAREFLSLFEAGRAALERIPSPKRRPKGFSHGDFHPDQIAFDAEGRAHLLDLDALGLGDPADDAASWIADRLAAEPDTEFGHAARELCEPAGLSGEIERIRAHVAEALGLRAAAALRRLEVGALARAQSLCERALELARAGNPQA
ncbi:MAG: phosphotransferase [Planctomycetes bacterium]|nr:phosphotransferase [Planctomycetota bacterium]